MLNDFLIPGVSVAVGTSITAGAIIVVRHMCDAAGDDQTNRAARAFAFVILAWVLVAWARTTLMDSLPVEEIFDRGPTVLETTGALSLTIVPLAVYGIARRRSDGFNRLIAELDPRTLIGAQFYRMTGIIFLLYAIDGQMPKTIGVPTGIAAFCTGLFGFTLFLLNRADAAWWRRAAKLWSWLGLGYFSYASVTCFSAAMGWMDFDVDPTPVFTYPIAFIGAFGLPFSIIVHLMTNDGLRRKALS